MTASVGSLVTGRSAAIRLRTDSAAAGGSTFGGTRVNNLEDNMVLFGLKGTTNIFAQTYTEFGRRTVEMFPDILKSFPPADQVVDLSFIKEIARDFESARAETAEGKSAKFRQIVALIRG